MTNCPKCDCPLLILNGERRRLCVRCRKPRVRDQTLYWEENRTTILLKAKERYQKQREIRLLQVKAYYLANRERILAKKKEREQLRQP